MGRSELYLATSDEWGAPIEAPFNDFRLHADMIGVDPETLTADDEHIYCDGEVIADRVEV